MSTIHNPPFPNNYATEFLVLEHGEGSYLYDEAGNKYLDFTGGIAVNSLGYGHRGVQDAVAAQMRKLVHVSNLFTTRPAVELAEMLAASSPLPADQPWSASSRPGYFTAVHFGNSGTEANEAAIKYARIYASRKESPNGAKILAFRNGFHGRTLGALSVTFTPKYRAPYEPLIGGVEFVDYNDAAAVEKTLNTQFSAVIVEPIQGEGGLDAMSPEFAEALNSACARHDIILIADEVQTGLGRTGTLYASESCGLRPDIITLAKPLAGGLPLSATLIPEKVNRLIHVGDHGTTFGGGPVTCAAGKVVWSTINAPGFLEEVREKAAAFAEAVDDLAGCSARLGKQKGKGFLRGVELEDPELVAPVLAKAKERGLLLLRSGNNILRMAPPLTASIDELYDGVRILRTAVEEA